MDEFFPEKLTEYQQEMVNRYNAGDEKRGEKLLDFVMTALAPEQYGVEEQMLKYIQENPEATLEEVDAYFVQIAPPLEFTDDEGDK